MIISLVLEVSAHTYQSQDCCIVCDFDDGVWGGVGGSATVNSVKSIEHTALGSKSPESEGRGDVLPHSDLLWAVCEEVYYPCTQRGTETQGVQLGDQLVRDDIIKCIAEVYK